jgi:hypothetical protein
MNAESAVVWDGDWAARGDTATARAAEAARKRRTSVRREARE